MDEAGKKQRIDVDMKKMTRENKKKNKGKEKKDKKERLRKKEGKKFDR